MQGSDNAADMSYDEGAWDRRLTQIWGPLEVSQRRNGLDLGLEVSMAGCVLVLR